MESAGMIRKSALIVMLAGSWIAATAMLWLSVQMLWLSVQSCGFHCKSAW